jgi:hypothetical protein
VADPDGDGTEVRIEYRQPGSDRWSIALTDTIGPDSAASPETSPLWRGGEGKWSTAEVAEGGYEVRAIATDRISNHPGEGREDSSERSLLIVVDRTPPEIATSEMPDGTIEIRVQDRHSSIRRLEIRDDGDLRFLARPVDGVCDSARETFHIRSQDGTDDGAALVLRAIDAAGNVAERRLGEP